MTAVVFMIAFVVLAGAIWLAAKIETPWLSYCVGGAAFVVWAWVMIATRLLPAPFA